MAYRFLHGRSACRAAYFQESARELKLAPAPEYYRIRVSDVSFAAISCCMPTAFFM
jgi:hypothetical protein